MISIYALINPINDYVFYIGATNHPERRLIGHVSSSKNTTTPKNVIIQEIINAGRKVEMEILDVVERGKANFWEDFYTGLFKSYGFDLTNPPLSNYPQFLSCEKADYFAKTVKLKIPIKTYNAIEAIWKDSEFSDPKTLMRFAINWYVKQIIQRELNSYPCVRRSLLESFNIEDDIL